MKDKDMLKQLLKDGWIEKSVRGSHHKLVKGDKTVIVPVHGEELKKATLNSILKQAGLK